MAFVSSWGAFLARSESLHAVRSWSRIPVPFVAPLLFSALLDSLWFSDGFPIGVLWFFLWFSFGVPVIFLWFSFGFLKFS